MRRIVPVLAAALFAASSASAAGPWLGTRDGVVSSSGTAYVTKLAGAVTTITAVRRGAEGPSTSIAGRWGVPVVTLGGRVGGLSADGRVLVLAERVQQTGELHPHTSFAVLGTRPLALGRTIRLNGDFGFDALSADGRTLYLIEHVSQRELLKYRVRAYDLRADRLLPRVIADKRQAGWLMSGWPVARAATADGRWVYTLYSSGDNYPFVHALDTKMRTAVCIGLPWDWRAAEREIQTATLSLRGRNLTIGGAGGTGTRFRLDTQTFRIVKLGS